MDATRTVVALAGVAEQAISAAGTVNRPIVLPTVRGIREDVLAVLAAGVVVDQAIPLVRGAHAAGRDAAAPASGRLRQHGHLSGSVARLNCLM
jgi:hypothetical protein